MRSFALICGFFAAAVIATPVDLVKRNETEPCDDDAPPCMTIDQATTVAGHFKELIADYSDAKADQYLTVDFSDYSDSVAELINSGCTGPQVLGEPAFASLESFKAGQGSQPAIPFEILQLWHTCDTVVIRWRTTVMPGATQIVTGIIVMETEYVDGEFLIDTVYSEFNSGAWLVDLGVFDPVSAGICDANGNGPAPPSKMMRI